MLGAVQKWLSLYVGGAIEPYFYLELCYMVLSVVFSISEQSITAAFLEYQQRIAAKKVPKAKMAERINSYIEKLMSAKEGKPSDNI